MINGEMNLSCVKYVKIKAEEEATFDILCEIHEGLRKIKSIDSRFDVIENKIEELQGHILNLLIALSGFLVSKKTKYISDFMEKMRNAKEETEE